MKSGRVGFGLQGLKFSILKTLQNSFWRLIGARLAPGWRPVGARLAPGWRQIGARLAPDWRPVGARLAPGRIKKFQSVYVFYT